MITIDRGEHSRTAAEIIRRAGPLPQSADWTHEYADAESSYFSRDRRVRPPLEVLWYGDGPDHGLWTWHDYNTGIKPQVVGGRLFAQRGGEFFAYDAYTGRLLWTAKIDRASRSVSLEDGVYLAGVNTCAVYDPASGRRLHADPLEVEPGRPAHATAIRVAGDVIAITAAKQVPGEWGHIWEGTSLTVLDRTAGRILWTRRAAEGFHYHALALGDGTLFCVESPSRVGTKKTAETEKPAATWQPPPSTLLALDARSGKTRWSATTANQNYADTGTNTAGIRDSDDWLGYCREPGILLTGKTSETSAFNARSGKPLWHERIGGWPMILCGEKFLTQQGQPFNVRTGKRLGPALSFSRGGCNYAVASSYLMMFRDQSASYIDLASSNQDDSDGKTAVIQGDQATLKKELQKAKEQEACLIIIRGTPQGHRYFLTQPEMTLGRDSTADITVSDQSISRKHAKITKETSKVFITDLGSSNGTFINDKKIESRRENRARQRGHDQARQLDFQVPARGRDSKFFSTAIWAPPRTPIP